MSPMQKAVDAAEKIVSLLEGMELTGSEQSAAMELVVRFQPKRLREFGGRETTEIVHPLQKLTASETERFAQV